MARIGLASFYRFTLNKSTMSEAGLTNDFVQLFLYFSQSFVITFELYSEDLLHSL